MKRFALIAAAALVLTGCAAQTPPPVSAKVQDYYDKNVANAKATLPAAAKLTGTASAKAVTGKLDTDNVNLLLAPKPNGTLVIAAHGHGGTVKEWSNGVQQLPMLDALIDNGYSVATSDARGNGWGNAESVDSYKALTEWAKTKGKFSSVVILAQSMGGLAGFQLFNDMPDAKTLVGIYPVCNLGTVAARFPSAAEAWPDGAEGNLSPVDLSGVKGKRMILFASPHDSVVPMATNTDACAAAAKAAGADVRVVEVGGDHGDQDAFRPGDVIEFLTAAPAR